MKPAAVFALVFVALLVLCVLLYFVANALFRLSKWLEANTQLGTKSYVVVQLVFMCAALAGSATWMYSVLTAARIAPTH